MSHVVSFISTGYYITTVVEYAPGIARRFLREDNTRLFEQFELSCGVVAPAVDICRTDHTESILVGSFLELYRMK